jgi:hypothetical protein
MSRYYEMTLEVTNIHSAEDQKKVSEIFEDMWERDDCPYTDEEIGSITLTGRGSLYGGETEEQFTTRLTHALWRDLGRFVPVAVNATYLEDLPCEAYQMAESDYEEFLKESKANG